MRIAVAAAGTEPTFDIKLLMHDKFETYSPPSQQGGEKIAIRFQKHIRVDAEIK